MWGTLGLALWLWQGKWNVSLETQKSENHTLCLLADVVWDTVLALMVYVYDTDFYFGEETQTNSNGMCKINPIAFHL